MSHAIHADETLSHEALLDELIALRQAVAEALGRRQYLYAVIDEAVESAYAPKLETAWAAFQHQPDEVRDRVRQAMPNQ